jgi:hypothetical protein
METIAMRTEYLAAGVIAAFAAGAGFAVYSVRSAEYCPQPSAASVTALFAPCQAFDTAMGHAVTKKEAVQMGLLRPNEQPTPPATQFAADEHATVGAATTKRAH